jgi:hypothetical protein
VFVLWVRVVLPDRGKGNERTGGRQYTVEGVPLPFDAADCDEMALHPAVKNLQYPERDL